MNKKLLKSSKTYRKASKREIVLCLLYAQVALTMVLQDPSEHNQFSEQNNISYDCSPYDQLSDLTQANELHPRKQTYPKYLNSICEEYHQIRST